MSKSDSCLNLTSTGGHQYIKREPIDETVELTLIPEVVQTPKEVSPPPPAATPTGHTKIILETVEPIQFQYNQSPQPPTTNQTTNNQPIKKEAGQVPHEKKKRSKPTKASNSATGGGEKKESKPKKHACTLCPKKFTRPAELQRHIRVHTGEKPFKCQFDGCEKTFSNSSDRKKHAQIHMTGVFECPLPGCDRTYCHASSMRKHMKTHGKSAIGLKMPSRTVSSSLYDPPIQAPAVAPTSTTPSVVKSEPILMEKFENSIGSLHQSGTESSGSEGSQSPQPAATIPTNELDMTSNELYDPNAYYNAYYSNLATMQQMYGANMANYTSYPMESMNQMMWSSYAANYPSYENSQPTYTETDSFHLHN